MRVIVWMLLLSGVAGAQRRVERDVVYGRGAGVELKLDVSVPAMPGPHPAVILVHGGGWEAGSKDHEWIRPLFAPIERAGWAWFSIDYRLAPAHVWPACLDDVKQAVRWIRQQAARYGVDPERLVLAGESAGGHLVNWVGVDPDPGLRVRGVISFYGISDFVSRYEVHGKQLAQNARQLLGLGRDAAIDAAALERMRAASPIHQVRRGMPPFLLIHGTEDRGVPVEQSTEFCRRIRAAGSRCEVLLVAGAGHGVSSWEVEEKFRIYQPRMIEWLRREIP